MIIQDLSDRKEEAVNILISVFQSYWPEADRAWFEDQIKSANLKISLGYIVEERLVAVYILKEEKYYTIKGKGLRGEALAVLPDHRKQKIPEQFFNYIKNNYDFDYLWGSAAKKLDNLNFWLKYRKLLTQDPQHYYTIQYLRIPHGLDDR